MPYSASADQFAKIGLPLQIAGFAGIFLAWGFHSPNWEGISALVHLAGDILFFIAMKKEGCA